MEFGPTLLESHRAFAHIHNNLTLQRVRKAGFPHSILEDLPSLPSQSPSVDTVNHEHNGWLGQPRERSEEK